jgi:chemotaxis protein CheZ
VSGKRGSSGGRVSGEGGLAMSERKLFTAELQLLKAQRGEGGGSAPASGEVMGALEEIKAELKILTHLVKGEEPPPPSAQEAAAADVMLQKQAEVSMLKTELRALAVCIEQTKVEIAALKPNETAADHLIVVANELDAIVSSTERATQQILEGAEKIEVITQEIQSHADSYVNRLADDINEVVVGIYEACNFQDITGQRITKVVRTLKYIEDRVNAMIDIWGPENIADIIPKAQEEYKDDEAKLLNGPALENQGISQADIDALFG